MSTLLHNDVITTTGLIGGTIDGDVFVLPVTAMVSSRVRIDVESATGAGNLYFTGVNGSVDGIGGWLEAGPSQAVPVGTTGESLLGLMTNSIWTGVDPSGFLGFLRAGFVIIGSAIELKVVVTLLDGIDVIVQTFPTPTVGANSYVSVPDALLRLPQISPNLVSFALLGPDRQAEILVAATERIELEVVRICEPKGSSLRDPDVQKILWPRDNAYPAIGPVIESWLPSWEEAILLYADKLAAAELRSKLIDDAADLEGIVEIESEPEGAGLKVKYVQGGAPSKFFSLHPEIFAKLAESFAFGGTR